MASRSYRFWTALEIHEAIRAIEFAKTTVAASVSYQGGGAVQYTSRENFDIILKELNDAYDRIALGENPADKPALSRVRIIARRGW